MLVVLGRDDEASEQRVLAAADCRQALQNDRENLAILLCDEGRARARAGQHER